MNLKKSVAAYGTNRFAAELAGELTANRDFLALENVCWKGGTPDNLTVNVRDASDEDGVIWVRFGVAFQEVNCTKSFPRHIGYHLKIEKQTGEIELEDDT